MNSMWSKNKYVNITINVLLFLVSINIFHYGQLLLPLICLIIFIDNKFVFEVANLKIFVVLFLFAISYFAFSYKLGFYSVMGACLPMAYYIGSNLRNESGKEIKYLIYIISFGMAMHLILNFSLEFYWWHDNLSYLFNKVSHYDIWLMENLTDKNCFWLFGCNLKDEIQPTRVKTTGSSMNFLMISSCIYYLMIYEKKKTIKILGIIIFILSGIYCVALGRRTTFILLLVALATSFLIDFKFIKNMKINKKTLLIIFSIVCLFLLMFIFNVFNFRLIILNNSLVKRFLSKEFSTERFEILLKSIPLYFKYPWGGQKISGETGQMIHDLWGDIYDYAGIVPFLLMAYYSIHFLFDFYKVIKNTKIKKDIKLILAAWFVTNSLIMFIEPVMSGASLFLICYFIISSSIERLKGY